MTYVKLIKIRKIQQAVTVVMKMGFADYKEYMNKTQHSIFGYWVAVKHGVKKLPKGVKEGLINPIFVLARNKVHSKSATGWIRVNTAYITEEKFEELY